MRVNNLFAGADPPPEGERFETLLTCRNVVVERIISSATAAPGEYMQPQDEWVALLRGRATLEIAGETVDLAPGDHLFLPAGMPHRVLSTSGDALWLAVHMHP
jgi:cupin 2 domain-containing protein